MQFFSGVKKEVLAPFPPFPCSPQQIWVILLNSVVKVDDFLGSYPLKNVLSPFVTLKFAGIDTAVICLKFDICCETLYSTQTYYIEQCKTPQDLKV